MKEIRNRWRGKGMGVLLSGLALVELGTLQFLNGYLGIPWSEMWPLFLLIPGGALIFRSASRASFPSQ